MSRSVGFRSIPVWLRSPQSLVTHWNEKVIVDSTENYGKTAAVRREFFKDRFPTATGVIVAGLLREGALIEISAVAVLPTPAVEEA